MSTRKEDSWSIVVCSLSCWLFSFFLFLSLRIFVTQKIPVLFIFIVVLHLIQNKIIISNGSIHQWIYRYREILYFWAEFDGLRWQWNGCVWAQAVRHLMSLSHTSWERILRHWSKKKIVHHNHGFFSCSFNACSLLSLLCLSISNFLSLMDVIWSTAFDWDFKMYQKPSQTFSEYLTRSFTVLELKTSSTTAST